MAGTVTWKMSKGQIAIQKLTNGGQVIPLVTGVTSILQRLTIRMLTWLGEDNLHPECGLPVRRMVGVLNIDYIRGSVTACLLADPDVESVGHVDVTLDKSTLEVRIANISSTVKLKSGQRLVINSRPDTEVYA